MSKQNKEEKIENEEQKKSKKEMENERIRVVKEQGEETLQKSYGALKDNLDVNSYVYKAMDSALEMAYKKYASGCFVIGRAGLGKTYRAIAIANKMKVKYSVLRSKISPPSLVVFFWENRDKDVLIIDDPVGLVNKSDMLGLLKSVLWSEVEGEDRIASYQTQRVLKDCYGAEIPPSFPVNFSLVILTNKVNEKSEDYQAIKSRIFEVKVRIPKTELFRIMDLVASKPHAGLDLPERKEVIEFIKEQAKEGIYNIDLRTLMKGFQARRYAKFKNDGQIWRDILLSEMKVENPKSVIADLMNDKSFDKFNKPIDARVQKYLEITEGMRGSSRATFFRICSELKKEGIIETDLDLENSILA